MGAPTIVIKQFDVYARIDEIEAILEIGNGEWSRTVDLEGYDYTVIVSDRFVNPNIDERRGEESDTAKRNMIVKYWTIGVTPQSWGMTANDPLGYGKMSEESVRVVHYPMWVETTPCVLIGWLEGFEFSNQNRTHIKIKRCGYEEDSEHLLLCGVSDKLIDEFSNYGLDCKNYKQDDVLLVESNRRSVVQQIAVQTNIYGPVNAPLASGKFESAAAVGGGEAVDQRESQGLFHKPRNIERDLDSKGAGEK
ncbi:MAG: hypothetical protein JW892_12320 [Anaerolineae bacterium]|nr:hypothetical protein [Anaerolineae bacterium]